MTSAIPENPKVAERADEIYASDREKLIIRTDRLFSGLMIAQWAAAMLAAVVIAPRTWNGALSTWHPHVWSATLLGGAIMVLPVILVALQPGKPSTRHIIAVAQMLMGALLIHLSGGRIETHFHVFGSLAFLAFYRDWPVLITASAVVAADHFFRGFYWPQSVFGIITASEWRWLEHAGWVVFLDVFLVTACIQGVREMKNSALRLAELEATNSAIDNKVRERTAELAQHREQLEEMIEERTAKLRVAMEELQTKNVQLAEASAHKSRFLSTMSHELRTPLNAILGFTDLLLNEGFGPLNAKQKDYVSRVDVSGEHLLALINDVLDVAKIDAGAMELNSEPLCIESSFRAALTMVSTQLTKKQLNTRVEVAPGTPNVIADARKLKQVLLNLIGNAIKYSPEGTTITLSATPTEGNMVRISVHDEGAGIAPEHQAKIFNEFHQADRRRDEALGGIGLGLALTRRLVELHGGKIFLMSQPGEGTTFYFVLPGAAYESSPLAKLPEQEPSSCVEEQNQLILVAEDNEHNLEMITNMLSLRNYRVLIARNGRECIELATKHHPDLILTDVRMPLMDGLEATRTLRELKEFHALPIIALTANASAVSERECIESGCNGHVSKPVKSQRLFAVLDQYLVPTLASAN